jgi:hypothetical protein
MNLTLNNRCECLLALNDADALHRAKGAGLSRSMIKNFDWAAAAAAAAAASIVALR